MEAIASTVRVELEHWQFQSRPLAPVRGLLESPSVRRIPARHPQAREHADGDCWKREFEWKLRKKNLTGLVSGATWKPSGFPRSRSFSPISLRGCRFCRTRFFIGIRMTCSGMAASWLLLSLLP